MTFLFPPVPPVGVRVRGVEQLFPVHRVYCVGRNYAAHAQEMGSDPEREPPFFFCKPPDAVVCVPDGQTFDSAYPRETANLHYEVELVAAIGIGGYNISVDNALAHVYGYAIGLDMTRRDLQLKMRESGRPWEIGKSYDESAPIASIVRAADVPDIGNASITLTVNGATKQSSSIDNLIWSVAETVSHLSRFFDLVPGDLIYTGTPAGVGPVIPGDLMIGSIDGLSELKARIIEGGSAKPNTAMRG